MRIAVAIDGSENALRATEHAVFLAKHLPAATLEFIFVVDLSKVKDDRLMTQSPESLALEREKKISPAVKLAEGAGVTSEVTVLRGQPSQEIIKYVNDQAIAQLVLGSRGLNTFQEMVLGSVSHKVMKHVNCPVTVVS